ncbi:MAG: Phosphoesterase, RecJ-like protein [candidate division TM6 bacterium GW2011_GWF2_37_49]|nr:MAG: Phosphoesterase, RecJ-like protein [candidate division TM6 bacterium GW2011_GWF2_37_49]
MASFSWIKEKKCHLIDRMKFLEENVHLKGLNNSWCFGCDISSKFKEIVMSKGLFEQYYASDQVCGAWELVKAAKNITLLTHSNADGDGISACAALDYILRKMGKNTETIYPDKPEFNYKRQPTNLLINKHCQMPQLIIVCDVANYERLYWPKEFHNIPMINIDHHISNSLNGKFNFINAEASSASEELYVVLHYWDANLIDGYVAECLLFGLLYDSQIFQIHPLQPRTLKIAADLMLLGADLFKLEKELLSNNNHKTFVFWGKILSNIKVAKNGTAAWVCITKKDLLDNDMQLRSLIGFNNLLSQICDVDVTLLFYEKEDGKIKVSLRSKTTDVNAVAKLFGGGGHTNAAGILTAKSMDQIVKEITEKL